VNPHIELYSFSQPFPIVVSKERGALWKSENRTNEVQQLRDEKMAILCLSLAQRISEEENKTYQ